MLPGKSLVSASNVMLLRGVHDDFPYVAYGFYQYCNHEKFLIIFYLYYQRGCFIEPAAGACVF
jgi:hypothetical protein